MFCPHCGARLEGAERFCQNCGAPLEKSVPEKVTESFDAFTDAAAEQARGAYQDVKNGLEGVPVTGPLRTDRSLLIYVLLSIITCGIYGLYFIYAMARDINIACEGDGQKTRGLLGYFLLSIITCGIYPLFWEYSIGNRMAEGARRYGMEFQENGTTVLMWQIFGVALCGIGPFMAMYILIKNANRICAAYNQTAGL